MPPVFLKTHRLCLRQFTPEDLPLLLELDTDPEVMHYINGGIPLREELLREKVLPQMLDYHRRFEDLGYWAAHELSTHAFIGWFFLLPTERRTQTVELGYRLKPPFWGNGYATELSAALVARAFMRQEVRQIEAKTMRANTASIRVMEKVGLRFAEEFQEDRFPGKDKRAVCYRLSRQEYEQLAVAAG